MKGKFNRNPADWLPDGWTEDEADAYTEIFHRYPRNRGYVQRFMASHGWPIGDCPDWMVIIDPPLGFDLERK